MKTVRALSGQAVTVVGLGKSGQAAIDLLLARGARVTAVDDAATSPKADGLRARGVDVRLGGIDESALASADLVVVSPGVPLARPEFAAARAAGVEVVGEVELAVRCLPHRAGPLLGVTGTNGKSTTTALLGELVRAQHPDVFVGGNLGRPLSEACASAHPLHVVELSSFQLEGITQTRFIAAGILNLQADHLDRYADMAAYGAAKARIFANQQPGDAAVVNADDAAVVPLLQASRGAGYGFTLGPTLIDAHRRHRFVGYKGLAVGRAGTGDLLLVPMDEACPFVREAYSVTGHRALRGDHNLQNAMAAVLLARLAGVSPQAVREGLARFPGLAHRLEFVRELAGVEWINDSKATNVDSALVALKALTAPTWLIAGGKGKGAPYTPLVEAGRGKLAGVLTIGDDASKIEAAFAGVCDVVPCQSLARAVSAGHARARRGEVVLLSPACASYDQFQNFEDRGDTFKRLVREL